MLPLASYKCANHVSVRTSVSSFQRNFLQSIGAPREPARPVYSPSIRSANYLRCGVPYRPMMRNFGQQIIRDWALAGAGELNCSTQTSVRADGARRGAAWRASVKLRARFMSLLLCDLLWNSIASTPHAEPRGAKAGEAKAKGSGRGGEGE